MFQRWDLFFVVQDYSKGVLDFFCAFFSGQLCTGAARLPSRGEEGSCRFSNSCNVGPCRCPPGIHTGVPTGHALTQRDGR